MFESAKWLMAELKEWKEWMDVLIRGSFWGAGQLLAQLSICLVRKIP